MNNIINGIHHDLEHMDQICLHCGAKFWMSKKNQRSTQISPTFTICCVDGKVKLIFLLKSLPYSMNMYTSLGSKANSFCKNARSYNSLLACILFKTNVNEEFQKTGVSNFVIHDQVYHLIRSLLPEKG